jgi:two-component system LytT family sensor kinase
LGLLAILAFVQTCGTLHSLLFVNPTFQKNALNVPNEQVIFGILPGFVRLFGNPPLFCCLLFSLKMLKNWYLKQKENTLLLHENTLIELQLLKAQVHPHFLFNTLNNIYSFTLNRKPGAGDLLRKLSGMLHYMIHECQSSLVPLEKEIKLIEDYIGLEKVRYGQRLSLQVVMQGDFKDKMIAPLLIIPFIENSFKHGTSNMLQDPWLKLELNVHDKNLFFELSNSKPPGDSKITEGGIGLNNVRKRLGLIYPDEHELRIESSEDSYKINMQIPVHSKIAMSPAEWDQQSLLQTKHAIHAG